MSTLLRNPLPQGGKDKSLPRGGALILSAFLLLAAASPAPAALCGNGTLDPGETCDDGNTSGRDCCSPSCELLDCPSTAASPVRWQELGPFSVGGRVSALAASPQDPRILYAGTPAAGVWRSDDGGRSWTGVARWLGSLPVSALAVDPRDPDIVLLGTGAISEEGAAERSVGILRTTDGGLSWVYAADGWPAPYVASLRFWDDEPERVLAATEFGIRLSRDGGASFREVLVGRAFSALAQDPFDAEGAYAAGPSGLYGSADRGETWSELAPWPVAPSAVALAVSHQTPGLLYAAVRVPAAPDRVLLLRSSVGASVAGPLTLPRSLPPSRSTTRFAVPVEPARRDSGVILTHRGAADVAVEFSLRDVDGVELGARTAIVPAGGQIVVLSRELFAPQPDSFRGFLRGSSPAAVGAVGVLRQLNPRGEEILAGFPVVDLRAKGSSRYYAYAVDGDSWSSEWWFLNRSAAPSTVNLAFRGEGGETRYLPMEER